MTKYDWETIKKDYVHGIKQEDGTKHFPTQEELCTTYGCAKGTLGTRASKEDWKGQREKISNKIDQKVAEKKTEREAEDIVQSDLKFENAGELLRKVTVKKLKAMKEDLDVDHRRVRAYDIKNCGDALKDAQDVVKTAQGELLEKTKIEIHNDTNLNILDDDFMSKELDFMKELIKK